MIKSNVKYVIMNVMMHCAIMPKFLIPFIVEESELKKKKKSLNFV